MSAHIDQEPMPFLLYGYAVERRHELHLHSDWMTYARVYSLAAA